MWNKSFTNKLSFVSEQHKVVIDRFCKEEDDIILVCKQDEVYTDYKCPRHTLKELVGDEEEAEEAEAVIEGMIPFNAVIVVSGKTTPYHHYSSTSPNELFAHSEDVFDTIEVTDEEAANCENDTRYQSKCKQWFSFRSGRITASRMKAVCRTPINNPSKSLLKDICYQANKKFSSKATEWGCEHGSMARHQYFTEISKKYENSKIKDVGFTIEYPYMGASPDGKASCDCCGKVLKEIKCPFCKRDSMIDNSADCITSD
ncbi:unnamed protein product [Mytilus coruscus]|uniref:YqaJ viral recombinase domain-containing protein n=1 Tax=Mytilus coruscus TaxID=42192 RepID=A0A6J8DAR6_MYTCO|nr:unnamed protein product [Mytilus coruscus]